MTRGLGCEIYPPPFTKTALIEGNSDAMASQPQPIEWLDTPSPPDPSALFNKTGSTNGFGSYVAYIAGYQILNSVGQLAE